MSAEPSVERAQANQRRERQPREQDGTSRERASKASRRQLPHASQPGAITSPLRRALGGLDRFSRPVNAHSRTSPQQVSSSARLVTAESFHCVQFRFSSARPQLSIFAFGIARLGVCPLPSARAGGFGAWGNMDRGPDFTLPLSCSTRSALLGSPQIKANPTYHSDVFLSTLRRLAGRLRRAKRRQQWVRHLSYWLR